MAVNLLLVRVQAKGIPACWLQTLVFGELQIIRQSTSLVLGGMSLAPRVMKSLCSPLLNLARN